VPRCLLAELRTTRWYRRGTSENDISAGVVRPGIDRIDKIIRPRHSFKDVVDNRTALRGKFGEFFLRDNYDGTAHLGR